TLNEAAADLRISVRHLRDLIVQHRVPVLRLGRRVVFDAQSFAALETACRCASSPVQIPERYGSWARSARPAPRKESGSAAVLALIQRRSQERKQRRLNRTCSGQPG